MFTTGVHMKLNDAIAQFEVPLTASSGKYLKFDQDSTEWSVVNLNCFEKFIRWIGFGYGSTTLKHIAVQIGKEDLAAQGLSVNLKNRIHQLWQKTYPNDRNPLKMDPFMKLDPAIEELAGNVTWERLQVGNTIIHLSDSNLDGINDNFGGINVQPRDIFFEPTASKKDKIEKVLGQLKVTEGNGKSVLSFRWKLYKSILDVRDTTQLVLKTIEDYLAANPNTNLRNVIVNFDPRLPKTFIEAIEACRSMPHPHAQFVDAR